MSNLWTAGIAAGAAILASILTAYLTHYFERRRRTRAYELKWLEERFSPALDFLSKVLAIVSNAPRTPEGRTRIVEEIENIVVGSSKESNAWAIAILLDPENTGLQDYIHSAMTYARISENDQEFISYLVKLQRNLMALAEEFRRERQAIVSGKSLEFLIRGRKLELDKSTRDFGDAIQAVKSFMDGKSELCSALAKVQSSGVRGATLDWILDIAAKGDDTEKQARLVEVRRQCGERGWLFEGQKQRS